MVLYHILQRNSRVLRTVAFQSRQRRVYHQCEALYIIRNLLRYIIKPQENARWRVMRYKGGEPHLMIYATLREAMICQACGLDKQKENFV